MKSIAKMCLVGVAVAAVVALSAVPSEAARKKGKSASCASPAWCSTACKGGSCSVKTCLPDGKWHPAIFVPICMGTNCPPKC